MCHLSHIDQFSNVDTKSISFKYFAYMLANNGEPIASPSFSWYISDLILKYVVSTKKVNISIKLSIGMQVYSSNNGSAVSLSCITANVLLRGTHYVLC